MRSTVFVPTAVRAWLLALVLLASQAAGLAHRIVHAGGVASGTVAVAQDPGLWSGNHDPGSADCRLADQLGHADLLCAAPAAPLPLLPRGDTALAPALTQPPAATATVYQARGPPALQTA